MPTPHGRLYWLIVAVAAVVGLILLASIAVPLLHRGWGGDHAAELRATEDSLVVARAQTADAIRQMRERDQLLRQASATLDSVLGIAPQVIYLRRPAPGSPVAPQGEPEAGKGTASLPESPPIDDRPPGDTVVAYVPLPTYTRLATACRDFQSKCASDLQAKDAVIHGDSTTIRLQGSLIVQKDQQAARDRRAAVAKQVRAGGLGALTGALLCAFFCR